ncbi:hypothetical protein ACFL43_06930, partial [Thermodesulfobacteriota bacterium]
MRRFRLLCMVLIFFAGCLSGCAVLNVPFQKRRPERTQLDRVLQQLHLERKDFSVSRPAAAGPFNSDQVEEFLAAPLQMVRFADGLAGGFVRQETTLGRLVQLSGGLLGLSENPPGAEEGSAEASDAGSLDAAAGRLYQALVGARELFDRAFRALSRDEAALVQHNIEQLLFYGTDQQERTRREHQELLEQVFRLASRIDLQAIQTACYRVACALDLLTEQLAVQPWTWRPERVQTPLGDVVVGTPGDDVHAGDLPLLLIDPGGDDTYRFQGRGRFSVIVDVDGEDTYYSTNSGFLAAGIQGLGFLVDMAGDDRYEGDVYSFGCGLLGAGVLADLAGDDRYRSRAFSQGAATLGLGILYDIDGDDAYACDMYGQGMGYVGGAGVAVDLHGNDTYLAGLTVPDGREEQNAFQTYAQGFGMGCRLYAPGGAGLLYNGSGNDSYQGSYFCQGAGYWRALGMLIDRGGDDRYVARRYAQGAGVHSACGLLYDVAGDDRYGSWGVSQGLGHDYALGILRDRSGNDRYTAEWLSQGAGNSRGLGLLVDDCGDDAYAATAGSGTQGAGVY